MLAETLPRLRFPEALAGRPLDAFAMRPGALRLEIGFGGGEHAEAIAATATGDALIASEVFLNGVASLLGRLVPAGAEATAPVPANLRLWDRDARTLLRLLPDRSLDGAFLLFPDPWPKARHAKRRFVHPSNLAELGRVFRPGAEWRVASDDPTYQDWVAAVMSAQTLFDASPPSPERPEGWPPTRYERKALRAGRQPLWWRFVRR